MWGGVKFTATSVTALEKLSVLSAECMETYLAYVEVTICTCIQPPATGSPSAPLPARLQSPQPSRGGEAGTAASPPPPPPSAEDAG